MDEYTSMVYVKAMSLRATLELDRIAVQDGLTLASANGQYEVDISRDEYLERFRPLVRVRIKELEDSLVATVQNEQAKRA
jgi:hypothetical protein